MMPRLPAHLLALTLVLLCLAQAISMQRLEAASAPGGFSGGSNDLGALLDRFLLALEQRDEKGLQALRVTEIEYRQLVVPGNVDKGEAPQILSGEASEYFWQIMDQKSRHFENLLLERFGGESFQIKDVSFEKGHKEYAGHQAWRRLSLTVTDAAGQDRLIRTGSILERDGQYKFVSFIRD